MDDFLWTFLDHHPTWRAALVIIAYLDLSLRLRFLERVVRLRKVVSIRVGNRQWTVRERWFRITSILQWLQRWRRKSRPVVLDNGRGAISESNLDEKIAAHLKRRKGEHKP